jgi:hypothetical protein
MTKVAARIGAATLVMMALHAHGAPVIANGSFESWSGNSFFNGGPGLANGAQVAGWNSTSGRVDIFFSPGYNASKGHSSLRVHPDSAPVPNSNFIYQDISGFEIGTTYKLSFDVAVSAVWAYGSWANISPDPRVLVSVGLEQRTIGPLTPFNASTAAASQPFSFANQSVTFTADSTSKRLQFEVPLSSGEGGVAIDNVYLTVTDAVPEVHSSLLFLLGLPVLAASLRNRRRWGVG